MAPPTSSRVGRGTITIINLCVGIRERVLIGRLLFTPSLFLVTNSTPPLPLHCIPSATLAAGCNFVMYVEKLMPNMLDSTGEHVAFSEYFIEAPQLFKRNDVYYALFSWCCCYCYQGSGIIVHTAKNPLGPWSTQGPDIACVKAADGQLALPGSDAESYPGLASRAIGDYEAAWAAARGSSSGVGILRAEPTPGQGCQRNDSSTTSSLRAQQSFIIKVDTPTGPEFIWTGDRWQQSWDGTKAHDPQTWIPLVFNDDGSIQPARWLDNFTMDVI